jgi:hypothetical protein
MVELDLAGIYVASIIGFGAMSLPIFLGCRWLLARTGCLRRVWHPALFETAIYLSILSLLVLA